VVSSLERADDLVGTFKEGRALVGRRRANTAISMGRAIAGLGVPKGIRQFVRYGYLQRNNLATHFAVPLGRFAVPDHKPVNLSCLDDLDNWLPILRRQARDKHAPVRLIQAERRLTDALFAVVQHPDDGLRWQAVLLRMADVEVLQIRGSGAKAGPIPRLRPEWVEAADDGSPEIRLALALALQSGPRNAGKLATGVRRHWLTLEKGRFKGTSSDRVMQARSGIDDAIALVSRRLIEAAQNGMRQLPLLPGFGCAASRHDLARLVAGDVDLDRCLALARALMALDLRACQFRPPRLLSPAPSGWPDDAWNAIRLALLPWPLPDGRHAGCDPAIVRRLESGDLAAALTIAIRRLRAAGIPCTVRAGTAPPETARRYAAALAFPIARDTAAQLAQRLSPIPKENAA
jgi:CRISPR-associated protein Csx17